MVHRQVYEEQSASHMPLLYFGNYSQLHPLLAHAIRCTLVLQRTAHLPVGILRIRSSGPSRSCSIAAGNQESQRNGQRSARHSRLCCNNHFGSRIRIHGRQLGMEFSVRSGHRIRSAWMPCNRNNLESAGRRIRQGRKGSGGNQQIIE